MSSARAINPVGAKTAPVRLTDPKPPITGPKRRGRAPSLRRVLSRISLHVVLLLICLTWVMPTLGAVVSSLRQPGAAASSGWWNIFTDGGISLYGYETAFASGELGRSLVSSLLVAIPSSIFLAALSSVVAYVFAVMKFPFKNLLFLLICATLVLPHQLALEPLFVLFTKLGLSGQYAGLWMFQVGFALPLSIMILREGFAKIPKALFEAAEVDGASPARTFLSIGIPSVVPGICSVLILNVISSWNDLLAPLLFLSGRNGTVTVQIAGLINSADKDNTTAVAAAAVVSLIIPLAIFLLLQKYFVRGFMSGAVKD